MPCILSLFRLDLSKIRLPLHFFVVHLRGENGIQFSALKSFQIQGDE